SKKTGLFWPNWRLQLKIRVVSLGPRSNHTAVDRYLGSSPVRSMITKWSCVYIYPTPSAFSSPFPSLDRPARSPPRRRYLTLGTSTADAMASGNLYISVIDDVVAKVRKDFDTDGVGDAVLNELQALWETKLMHCGAISGNIDRNRAPPAGASAGGATPPVHDLNVPYEATSEEYTTPTADMLFPPTPQQTPIQTPLPAGIDTGRWDYAPSPIGDMRNGMGMMNGADPETGRPSPFMQPPSPWMNQRPLGLDVNLAFAHDEEIRMMMQPQPLTTKDFLMMSSGKRKRDEYPSAASFVPQQDGCADQVA
uniref:Uncharacterized protein n=1 Tax=Aegilops tauschii subsp. strangulata TaxID=200361 RepID=A0A453M232_AEGTS